MILERDKVEFSPTLKELGSIVKFNTGHIIDAISNIKRLPDLLSKKSQKPVDNISISLQTIIN